MRPGFELGYVKDGKYYIHNHLVFNILVYLTHGGWVGEHRAVVLLLVWWILMSCSLFGGY